MLGLPGFSLRRAVRVPPQQMSEVAPPETLPPLWHRHGGALGWYQRSAVAGLRRSPAALSPCSAVSIRSLLCLTRSLPAQLCRKCMEREDGAVPPCSPGSTSIFVFKGYLCKQCLVPSPQPWRLKTSLLNGASAKRRSSNSQRPGGPGSLPLSEHVLCTQLCLNSGVLPVCLPRWHQGRTVPAASPLPHLKVPRSAAVLSTLVF